MELRRRAKLLLPTLSRILIAVWLTIFSSSLVAASGTAASSSNKPSSSNEPRLAEKASSSDGSGSAEEVSSSREVLPGSTSLSFGVFPFLSASHLSDGFAPLIAQLQFQIRQTIQFRSTRDYQSFMELLDQEAFDIAYVQPFDYVRIAKPRGYQSLVHRPRNLFARIVVSSRSTAKKLEDLRGKVLGLPPKVAAISYVTRAMIRDLGLERGDDSVQLQHFRTHDSCLQQLLVGNIDACSVGDSAAAEFEARMALKLKTIAETSPVPPSVIVGHSRLGDHLLKRIRRILHQMKQEPNTRAVLGLGASETLTPALDDEYDPVRLIWESLKEDLDS